MNLLRRIRTRRLLSFRRRVTAVTLVALFATTLAFAAHLHKDAAGNLSGSDQLCALCLHFARLGTTPESSSLFIAPDFTAEQPVSSDQPLVSLRPVFRYYSRGPPLI